jgi:hypothetical protein
MQSRGGAEEYLLAQCLDGIDAQIGMQGIQFSSRQPEQAPAPRHIALVPDPEILPSLRIPPIGGHSGLPGAWNADFKGNPDAGVR